MLISRTTNANRKQILYPLYKQLIEETIQAILNWADCGQEVGDRAQSCDGTFMGANVARAERALCGRDLYCQSEAGGFLIGWACEREGPSAIVGKRLVYLLSRTCRTGLVNPERGIVGC